MANELIDPSFENSDAAWLFFGSGTGRTTEAANRGAASALIVQAFGANFGQIVTSPTFESGDTWNVGAYFREKTPGPKLTLTGTTDGGAPDLKVVIYGDRWELQDTATSMVLRTTSLNILGDDITTDFLPVHFPTRLPSGTLSAMTFGILIANDTDVSGTGAWYVDDAWLSTDVFPVPIRKPDTNGPIRFQRGVFDEIHGTIHKEGEALRDLDRRLRRRDDIGLPTRDDVARVFGPPPTRSEREP